MPGTEEKSVGGTDDAGIKRESDGSIALEKNLDSATKVIVNSDYSPDNKAKALSRLSDLYKSTGDIAAIERVSQADDER